MAHQLLNTKYEEVFQEGQASEGPLLGNVLGNEEHHRLPKQSPLIHILSHHWEVFRVKKKLMLLAVSFLGDKIALSLSHDK